MTYCYCYYFLFCPVFNMLTIFPSMMWFKDCLLNSKCTTTTGAFWTDFIFAASVVHPSLLWDDSTSVINHQTLQTKIKQTNNLMPQMPMKWRLNQSKQMLQKWCCRFHGIFSCAGGFILFWSNNLSVDLTTSGHHWFPLLGAWTVTASLTSRGCHYVFETSSQQKTIILEFSL